MADADMSPVESSPHCLVFDSGMGGLTIVESLKNRGFSGRISYAADNGFFPYGDKSDRDLMRRITKVSLALYEQVKPDIFVIACNTASTLALEIVRTVLPIPIVGTVPAIKPASAMTQTGTIGVLATPGTLKRAYTDALVQAFARQRNVLTYGSVALVELAERHAAGEAVSDEALAHELKALFGQPGGDQIDTIVLACTHFPLLRDRLERLLPANVQMVDSGDAIARRTMNLLGQAEGSASSETETARLYLTAPVDGHSRLVKVASQYGFAETEIISPDD